MSPAHSSIHRNPYTGLLSVSIPSIHAVWRAKSSPAAPGAQPTQMGGPNQSPRLSHARACKCPRCTNTLLILGSLPVARIPPGFFFSLATHQSCFNTLCFPMFGFPLLLASLPCHPIFCLKVFYFLCIVYISI